MKKDNLALIRQFASLIICIVIIYGVLPILNKNPLPPVYYYPAETTATTPSIVPDEFSKLAKSSEPSKSIESSELILAEMTSINVEIVLNSSGLSGTSIAEQQAGLALENMTLEQKVGQMFFCAFRYSQNGGGIVEINSGIEKTIKDCGVGGVILFSENIHSAKQVTDFIQNLQQASDIPLFIGIDEEGGRVVRTRLLDVPRIPSALSIGNTGNIQNAYNTAKTIAGYLTPLGFNVDFAPVADVFTNPSNTVIGDRAFSRDAKKAGEMVVSFVKGALDNNMLPAVKHFPGHGDTKEDSHYGMATTGKTLAELAECEFIPFQSGINAGSPFVMIGHIAVPDIDKNPAVFSSVILQDILRDTLNFNRIIITDSLEMGAITSNYTPEETAVKAILAGIDMLLMPKNFTEAYNGVLNAVKTGAITERRIDESAKRILTEKYKAGILNMPESTNKQAAVQTYNINGNNYIKLRDIAYLLNGTSKQFEVGYNFNYNQKKNAVLLTSGKPYTAVGGEMSSSDTKSAKSTKIADVVLADISIYLDGKEISLTTYNINGNNYSKLRDIGKIFDFNITYIAQNSSKNIVVINPYEKYADS